MRPHCSSASCSLPVMRPRRPEWTDPCRLRRPTAPGPWAIAPERFIPSSPSTADFRLSIRWQICTQHPRPTVNRRRQTGGGSRLVSSRPRPGPDPPRQAGPSPSLHRRTSWPAGFPGARPAPGIAPTGAGPHTGAQRPDGCSPCRHEPIYFFFVIAESSTRPENLSAGAVFNIQDPTLETLPLHSVSSKVEMRY